MENSLRAKGCCRAGALPRSCGVLIGVAGMWNREKCARNSNIVHASFARALCMDSCALLGCPAVCRLPRKRVVQLTPQALTWLLLNQCSSYLLDSWLTRNGGNSIMLLAGRMGRQHVNAAEWLSERPPDYLLPAFHISAFCSCTSHAGSASAKALCSGKLCSLLEEAC